VSVEGRADGKKNRLDHQMAVNLFVREVSYLKFCSLQVALEVLSYHSKCSDRELTNVQEMQLPDPYPNLES